MKETVLTAIVVSLAITLGALADRMIQWWERERERPAKQPHDAQALGDWLKTGHSQNFFDAQFSVSTTNLEALKKWILDAPTVSLLAGETLCPGERKRLTTWFWVSSPISSCWVRSPAESVSRPHYLLTHQLHGHV